MRSTIPGLRWAAPVLLVLGLLAACATPTFTVRDDPAAFEAEVERLQRQLIDEPGDAEALRELGVIYLRTRRFTEGNRYLEQAFARDPDDAKTLFYLGLSNELLARFDTALRLYDQDVSRLSPYRRLMRGRAEHVRRLQARRTVVELLADEQRADTATSPRIVAVFPLALRGGGDRYEPLGRGLSEMMMTDLAQVSSLRIVERVRLQALLDELELAESRYVDPQTAPRTGRLLGAGRLVGGNFAVQDGDLALDVALVTAADAAVRPLETTSGDLDRLFDLQKQLVFRLIDEMGIELTPAERERIQTVPTRNLQAFLAYSRGLKDEEAGRFGAAARHYGQAAELDPSFGAAVEGAERAEGMEVTAGSAEQALAGAVAREAAPTRPVDLVGNRLDLMNATISGIVVPGEETREPVQESAPLGEPPAPPGAQRP